MSTPRTPDRPLAFTAGELYRGAFFAWIVFVGLVALGAAAQEVLRVDGDFRLGFGGAEPTRAGAVLGSAFGFAVAATLFGGVATLLALPVANRIGERLSTVAALRDHLLAYLAFGGGIGVLWLVIAATTMQWMITNSAMGLVIATAATLSVPTGWLLTAHCALRHDHRRNSEAATEVEP